MREFTTKNGAPVKIAVAPFRESMALKNAISKEIAATGIDTDALNLKNLNLKSDIDPTVFFKLAASVDASEPVYNALLKCLQRCTYKGEKITENTFEPEEAREDYYEIAFECVKANLAPFFKGLFAKLNEIQLPKTPDSPQPK